MTLNPPKGVLVNFSQFLDAAHISTLNCDEMAVDRPRQPVYEIFSTKRRFQQSKSRPLGSRRLVQEGVKDGCFPKKRLFYRNYLVCVKTVADMYRHAALVTSFLLNEFFAISGCDTHFKSELRQSGWRWTWTTCV